MSEPANIDTKERNCYFDNVKLVLILMVVLGHLIEPLVAYNYKLKAIYLFMYSFHMPVFIFVSGYFTRNENSESYQLKLLKSTLVPLLVFQVLYQMFDHFVLGGTGFELLTPYWIMWYMFSLFSWKLILPYFTKLKHPIAAALLISILAGYNNEIGYYLSISRTITFFPFFLAGYYIKDTHIQKLLSIPHKYLALVFLAVIFNVFYKTAPTMDLRWLYGSYSYKQLLGDYHVYAGLSRLFVYLLQAIASVLFLVVIPQCRTVYSTLGSRVLCIYMLHGFIVKLLIKYHFYNSINPSAYIPVFFTIAVFTVLMLSTRFTEELTRPFIRPKVDMLFNTGNHR